MVDHLLAGGATDVRALTVNPAKAVLPAGVRRIVDLAGPEGSQWHVVEEAVEESGIAWTHLDAGAFMTNSTIWAEQIRTTGTVRDAYPTAANAPIALEDIAAVAATVLLEDVHVGKAYQLTGPQSLTRAQQMRLIGKALGREIPFVDLAHEEAVAQLSKAIGKYASWYLDGVAGLVDQPQRAVRTVEELTGRPGRTFAEWALEHADGFRPWRSAHRLSSSHVAASGTDFARPS